MVLHAFSRACTPCQRQRQRQSRRGLRHLCTCIKSAPLSGQAGRGEHCAPVRQVNFIWPLTYMITLHIILAASYTDHLEINEFESTLLVATKNNNHLTVFRPH